ncbi:MAG: hypothetical protein JXA15_02365 [Spirochaetales bacterium]|nr:hypothetical protein [Spirochaetales bacterium]
MVLETRIIVYALAVLVVYAVVRRLGERRGGKSPSPEAAAVDPSPDLGPPNGYGDPGVASVPDPDAGDVAERGFPTPDMEEEFLRRAGSGEQGVRIARVYSPADLGVLESMLASAGIPHFVEFRNLSAVRVGTPIANLNDSLINVLAADLDDALAVIDDFLASKVSAPQRPSERMRTAAEVILGGWSVPSPSARTLEILVPPRRA